MQLYWTLKQFIGDVEFFPCSGRKLFPVTLVNPQEGRGGGGFFRVRLVGIRMGLHNYCTNGLTIVGRNFKGITRKESYSFGIADEGK